MVHFSTKIFPKKTRRTPPRLVEVVEALRRKQGEEEHQVETAFPKIRSRHLVEVVEALRQKHQEAEHCPFAFESFFPTTHNLRLARALRQKHQEDSLAVDIPTIPSHFVVDVKALRPKHQQKEE